METHSASTELTIKRRTNVEHKTQIPLAFQLVLLLRTRKEAIYLCTRTSLALRVAVLCQLVLDKEIGLKDGVVRVIKAPTSSISREFADKITQVSLGPRDLLLHLNGEKGKESGVTHLRKKIYAEMQGRGLIKTNKGMFFNNIKVRNIDVWESIYSGLIYEIQNNCISKESSVLLLGLNYVNMMDSFLIQCNETTASLAIERFAELKNRVHEKQYRHEDALLYQFLALLISS